MRPCHLVWNSSTYCSMLWSSSCVLVGVRVRVRVGVRIGIRVGVRIGIRVRLRLRLRLWLRLRLRRRVRLRLSPHQFDQARCLPLPTLFLALTSSDLEGPW